MNGYRELDVSDDGDVFRIAFDRPAQRNAVGERTHEELTTVFRDANRSDARAVVLTGSGEAFSAGGDLDWLEHCLDDPAAFDRVLREGEAIIEGMLALETPIVARVNGDAVGLGATLALFCDVAVASTDAQIGDPHIRVGLVPGDGGAAIWPLLVGLNRAKEFLMTGKTVGAETAAEMGLINRAVDPDRLDEAVDEYVSAFTDGPQPALRHTKRALNAWLRMGVETSFRESLALEGRSQRHPDHREGLAAVREGRRPAFPSATTEVDE